MKILMKSALTEKELLARKALTEENIEIQLFKEFYDEEISLDEYINIIISSGLNIDPGFSDTHNDELLKS